MGFNEKINTLEGRPRQSGENGDRLGRSVQGTRL